MRCDEVNKATGSTTGGCEKRIQWNIYKMIDVVNNSLVTTITVSEVFKTQCMTYVSWGMTFKLWTMLTKFCVFRVILRINSHHSLNKINRLVFVLTLIFFFGGGGVGSRLLGEMIHSKYKTGPSISHLIQAPTLLSERREN